MLGLTFLINVSILIGVSAIRSGREEIVFPSIETLRSGEKRLSFRALNQDIALKLEAAGDLFGKGFSVEFARDGKSEIPKLNIEDIKRSLYKDKRTGASLHIKDKERILINGIINDNLRIEPIESRKGRRNGAIPHRIYEVISNDNFRIDDAVYPTDYHPVYNERLEQLRADEPIYVEIGIITDSSFSLSFPDTKSLLSYVSVLINGAQCRYDNIKSIKVNLVLSSLKINKSTKEEPYIQNNIREEYVMIYDALDSFSLAMGKAGYSSDIIMLMSKRKMAMIKNGAIDTGIDGIAFIGRACSEQSALRGSQRVGISHDEAHSFGGAKLFAHECAHLLGCPHDGDGPDASLPGHPGSSKCPWSDGYMMSYVDNTINRDYFSSCCEENIKYLANRVDCLRKNNTGYNVKSTNQKPGEYMESLLGLSASNYAKDKVRYYNDRCIKLYQSNITVYIYPNGKCEFACRSTIKKNGSYTFWTIKCLDGEMCDVGKRCSNGICQ
nr:putative metalloprotease Tcis_Metallo_13 [Tityus cisandinus]